MNCMMEQTERQLQSLRAQIGQLGDDAASQIRREQLRRDMKELLEACRTLSPADKVYLPAPEPPTISLLCSPIFLNSRETVCPLRTAASMEALLCFTASR